MNEITLQTTVRDQLLSESEQCKRLSHSYLIAGQYKRIYHYHIRKTGGTSLNHVFHSLAGDPSEVHQLLVQRLQIKRIIVNNLVYVGWDVRLINEGDYYYAFSHIPQHALRIPPDTFTITCLRDPVKRVISHYRMLCDYKLRKINHPCMKEEGPWMGNSLRDFLNNVPNDHLFNQLYMFSPRLNVDEAFNAITTRCSYFFFTEEFAQGLKELSSTLKLDLPYIHTRKNDTKIAIDQDDIEILRGIMAPEYQLIERLREFKKSAPIPQISPSNSP